jgi:hypothetical protein
MSSSRMVAAALLAVGFVWLAGMNWYARYLRSRSVRHPSWIPVIGGLAGAVALTIIPSAALNRLWWIPLLADYGTVPGLLETLWFHWRRANKPHR